VVPTLVPEVDVALVVDLRPESLLSEELDVQIPDLVLAHVHLSFTRSVYSQMIIGPVAEAAARW
jgi:hypothetical protein